MVKLVSMQPHLGVECIVHTQKSGGMGPNCELDFEMSAYNWGGGSVGSHQCWEVFQPY